MSKGSQIVKKILSNTIYNTIYQKINPLLFDVSLRDGIQTAKVENFPTNRKKEIFHAILTEYNPTNIEIGSLTNPKILPIMNDTIELLEYTKQYHNPYILVPSLQKFHLALTHKIKNMSFITSTSNVFQVKNTSKTLAQTKMDFKTIFNILNREPDVLEYRSKLYISCVNKCPFFGIISNDYIVSEICYYHNNYQFNEICISDTCGELSYEDFKYIIEKCGLFGIPYSKFSLHLHVSEENMENLTKILHFSFKNNINKYDLSYLDTGGCSVTMKPSQIHNNLTYDLFYDILWKYIENQAK